MWYFTACVTLMSSPRQKNIYFFLSPRSSFLDRDFAASRFCSAAKKRMKSLLFFRQHTPKSCAAFSVIKRNPHNQFLSSVVSCKAVPYLKGNIYPFIRININLINQKIN